MKHIRSSYYKLVKESDLCLKMNVLFSEDYDMNTASVSVSLRLSGCASAIRRL